MGFQVSVTLEDTEIAAELLQQATVSLYENKYPLLTTGDKMKVPWWSPQLGKYHQETRKLWNKVKMTAVPCN
jgi:hypothetical protein